MFVFFSANTIKRKKKHNKNIILNYHLYIFKFLFLNYRYNCNCKLLKTPSQQYETNKQKNALVNLSLTFSDKILTLTTLSSELV